MATVTVTCFCGRQFQVDRALAGTSFPCPTCSRSNIVPGEAPTPAPAPERLATTIAAPSWLRGETAADTPARKRRAPAWAVVAAVGLAVTGLIVLVLQALRGWHEHRVTQLRKERDELPRQRERRQQELERLARRGQTQLSVTGPASLQAGAANTYVIETKTLTGEEAAARFTVRLLDRDGREVAKDEREAAGKFAYTVPLPAALKPDDQLTLEVTAARDGVEGGPVSLTENLPLERAGFVTHLTTDKPLYQPGEVVAFRSLTLERFGLKPPEEDLQLSFTITDPSGQVVFRKDGSGHVHDPKESGRFLEGPDNRPVRGVGFGEFAVPPGAPGGEYSVTISELRGRFAPQSRKFLVNRYQAPRLHKELEFTRRSYGPGDEVHAAARVRRIEGNKGLDRAGVTFSVVVDGEPLKTDKPGEPLKTDADGAVALRFKLPTKIERGEGTLTVTFNDGGNVETIVRPIPIVVRRLRVDFYPEGGDLVAGVPNRVYFSARTPLGKPAELVGSVVDAKGQPVAKARTLGDAKTPEANHGLGVFTFTPAAGQKYQLQIDSPAGIPYKAELPEVKPDGVVLKVDTGSASGAEPIKATVTSAGQKRRLLVAAYCRGRLVGSESVEVGAGKPAPVTITPAGGSGVFRVTVYEERPALVPVAERLIFRHPANYLNVAVQPDKAHYVSGEKVRLAVSTKDEAGKAAGAIALVQVVDKAALSLADDKTLRTLPTHVLLAGETKDPEELEHADFLLTDHPLAAVTVDLLLGTQGWRRFAEHDPEQFKARHGQEAERLLAAAGQTPLRVSNRRAAEAAAQPLINEARRKGHEEFGPKAHDLAQSFSKAQHSARQWHENAESCMTVGIVTLTVTVLAAALVVLLARLAELERKAPGTVGGVLAMATVGALMLGFIGIVVFGTLRLSMDKMAVSPSSKASSFANSGADVQRSAEMRPTTGAMPNAAGMAPMMGGERYTSPGLPPRPGGPGATRPGGGPARGAGRPKGDDATARNEAAPRDDLAGMAGMMAAKPDKAPESPAASPGDPAYATDKQLAAGESARLRYQRVQQEQSATGTTAAPAPPEEWSFQELQRDRRSLVARGAAEPFVVREYAHENRPGRASRADFTETVYWHPVLVLPGGETFVNFSLSDAVTSYQALAYVHTPDGRLGAARIDLSARLPFSLDAKIPVELTSTDELHLPLAVANDTDRKREVSLAVDARGLTRLDGAGEASLNVDAEKRARAVFKYKPSFTSGEAKIVVSGRSDFFADRVERTLNVVPEGFPVAGALSGTLARELAGKLVLPKEYTAGSLKVRAEVYPSPLADLITGMEGMLREPHGCFEQTSSSSYPNLLVLEYLQNTNQSRPEIARRAMDLIERGYNRLLTFECQKPGGGREGYEWFGGPTPPHEALTAYGLVQFHDLAKVYDKVDPAMVERTRKFLLSRRDGQGNFLRKQDYHNFGRTSQETFNAYIVWALCESEADADLNREVEQLIKQSESNTDPYFLALTANSLFLRNDRAAGAKILDRLVTLQDATGFLPGRESIVGSYGRDLHIEATALTVMAWLKAEQPLRYREPLAKAVRWLTQQRGGYGGFGSTQATILTLRALSKVARDSKRLSDASVVLSINGDRVLQQKVAATSTDTLVFELAERDLAKLKPGANELRLELTGEGELPAKIGWSYQTLQPPSAEDCPIKLTTKLAREQVNEGETVRLTAVVENTAQESQSMTVAVIGLPAGLSLPEDLKQLTELTKPRVPLAGRDTPGHAPVSYFEVRGRELVLYWRGLEAGQRVEVPVDLVARTPGKYRGPASRAYLYYGADAKHWAAPLSATIAAR